MKEAALLLQALGLRPNRLVLRALPTWPRSKDGATPGGAPAPSNSACSARSLQRPRSEPAPTAGTSSGPRSPALLPRGGQEARELRRGSFSWAPRFSLRVTRPCRGGGQRPGPEEAKLARTTTSGPGPALPARGSKSSCGFPERSWEEGGAETPQAADSTLAGRAPRLVLSQGSGGAGGEGLASGNEGSPPGRDSGLSDSGCRDGDIRSPNRNSCALCGATDPRGRFGPDPGATPEVQQERKSQKGVAADWGSSRDVVSTCSTRLAGGRLCLPRSHFAS